MSAGGAVISEVEWRGRTPHPSASRFASILLADRTEKQGGSTRDYRPGNDSARRRAEQRKAPNAARTPRASCSSYEPPHSMTVAISLQPDEGVPDSGVRRPRRPKGQPESVGLYPVRER